MISVLRKTLRPKVISILSAAVLASCGGEPVKNRQIGIWSSDITNDGCRVYDIVADYYTSGAKQNVPPSSSLRSLFQGDDSFFWFKYRNRDWHVLRFIRQSEEFKFLDGCRSEFGIEGSVNGTRNGATELFLFESKEDEELCRITSFRFRGASGTALEGKFTSGSVHSCIFLESGRTTFDVHRSE